MRASSGGITIATVLIHPLTKSTDPLSMAGRCWLFCGCLGGQVSSLDSRWGFVPAFPAAGPEC